MCTVQLALIASQYTPVHFMYRPEFQLIRANCTLLYKAKRDGMPNESSPSRKIYVA